MRLNYVVVLLGALLVVSIALADTCPNTPSFVIPSVTLASCATYTPTLSDGSLAFCNGIVNYPFYLPADKTRKELEQLAEYSLTHGSTTVGLLLAILPPQCALQLKKTACLSVFQACEYVDPTFVDTTQCGLGEYCDTCGDITTVTGVGSLAPSPTLAYGSVCKNATGDVIGNAKMCSVGPGKVPGLGNIGWELVKTISGFAAVSIEDFCQARNLTWSEGAKSCMAAVPRSACKGECNKLWNMAPTALCPLISGNWHDKLVALSGSSDTYVQAQALAVLALETPSTPSTPAVSTMSLLGALNLGPACNDVLPAPNDDIYIFGNTYTQEQSSTGRLGSLGLVIKLRAQSYLARKGEKCNCVTNLAKFTGVAFTEFTDEVCDLTRANHCSTLITEISQCKSATGVGSLQPNPSVQFVGINDEGMLPFCKKVVTNPNNQPPSPYLDLIQAAYGLPSQEAAMGAFFVAPTPGLPALAAGNMTRPLCAIPNKLGTGEVYSGYNSYECGVAATQSAERIVPPILAGTCRLAYLDLLCNTAHMKLEMKSMCLLPNATACASDPTTGYLQNKLPFFFALPRFPSRYLCTNFKTQCAGFLETLGPIGTPRRDLIEAGFDCTGTISQTCLANNPVDSWASTTWNCNSGLNGVTQYPTGLQFIADISALLGTYGADNSLPLLALFGASTAANATISDGSTLTQSTCECPDPLVVPDDPNAPTIAPGICCQQRCEGHMYSVSNFDRIILVQKIVSILSLIGTFFIIATWGTFKVKRSQPLTFFFAVASFNICLTFIIPVFYKSDPRQVWCRDNTQPHPQADGGMCLFQALYLGFWTMSACCFWLVQGFDLYLRIVRNQRHLDHMMKYYHLFAWSYPSIVIIVMLANNALGYKANYFWCFLADIPNTSLEKGLDLGLFYGSIIAIWFTGSVLMILVLYQIYKITAKTSGTAQVSNTTMKRLAMYRTPVFFVVFFVYVWASIFAWRFTNVAKEDPIAASAAVWIGCLLTNFAAGIADPAFNPLANVSSLAEYGIEPGSGCGDSYPDSIRFSDYVYLMCIAGLQGVFIFFIFGAKIENFNLWKEKMGLTTKKYDTTAEDSSTKDKSGKPSILSNAMSSLFSPSSPPTKQNESVEKDGGGSAVMVNGLQSGKFMAVTEPDMAKVKNNQVAAAYMAE